MMAAVFFTQSYRELSILNFSIVSVEALARLIPNGATVAVPKDLSGVSMAATRELVRARVRDLHLVCVPQSGIQTDILIGAGVAGVVETSAVSLGEHGAAPRFIEAVREGSIRLRDATCPAIYAALQAGEKGLPFIPLRGLIGSDVLARRPDWKVIDNPFGDNDPIVLLPPIRPDFALFHARLADRNGNVFVGLQQELKTMAHAAFHTLVTVEEISDEDLLLDYDLGPAVLPAIYVTAIAEAHLGAWPTALAGQYEADDAELARYAAAARTREGFDHYVEDWLASERAAA
jgi:glutaconate CoA-transferase, subunit A